MDADGVVEVQNRYDEGSAAFGGFTELATNVVFDRARDDG